MKPANSESKRTQRSVAIMVERYSASRFAASAIASLAESRSVSEPLQFQRTARRRLGGFQQWSFWERSWRSLRQIKG
jgi:hypothetical protein